MTWGELDKSVAEDLKLVEQNFPIVDEEAGAGGSNCLTISTEMEAIYLRKTLASRSGKFLPPRLGAMGKKAAR